MSSAPSWYILPVRANLSKVERVAFTAIILGSTTLRIDLFDHITSEDWERLIKRNDPKAIALPGVGDKAMRVDNSYAVDAWKNRKSQMLGEAYSA